jgi:hypothetical protein
MNSQEENNAKAAEEMETEIEERDLNRREHDTMLQKEVNQDVQTGTNDATHPGIKWGSSYQTKRKAGKRSRTKKAKESEPKR